MSYFEDLSKISDRLNEIYKPMIELMNNDALLVASRNLSASVGNIMALQQPLLSESLTIAINNMRETMNIMIPASLAISESIQAMMENLSPTMTLIAQNMSVIQDNYADMFKQFSQMGYNISSLAERVYVENYDEESNDDFENEFEIIEALQEQSDNPEGFQEKVANWSESKKKKYFIVVSIIVFIWTNFFAPYFQDTIGKPVAAYTVSKVREFPETASKIVGELKEKFEAIITEDVPYYYKVTFTDEDGNTKEGYVAKKNLQIIDDSEDEEGE